MKREEFMTSIKEIIGDRNDDVALGVLEYLQNDVSHETSEQIDKLTARVAELESQNKEIENTWRNKYKQAFFEKPNIENIQTPIDKQIQEQPKSFDSLFTEIKE